MWSCGALHVTRWILVPLPVLGPAPVLAQDQTRHVMDARAWQFLMMNRWLCAGFARRPKSLIGYCWEGTVLPGADALRHLQLSHWRCGQPCALAQQTRSAGAGCDTCAECAHISPIS